MSFIKKAFWFILPVLVVAVFFFNRDDSVNSIDANDVEFNLKLNRFDSTFFNISSENLQKELPGLREKYPAFFTGTSDQFWINQKPLGVISDPQFAKLFFGIWLHEATSVPAIRRGWMGTP